MFAQNTINSIDNERTDVMPLMLAQAHQLSDIHQVYQQSIAQLCAADYDAVTIEKWLLSKTAESRQVFIDNQQMWVAVKQQQIAGFVIAWAGEIIGLFVSPLFSRQGIASQLLGKGIELASGDGHETINIESTLTAQGFYQRFGFSIKEKGVYSHGESDLIIPVVYMEAKVSDLTLVAR